MQFYFIRHAQSRNNALYAETRSYKGRSEDPDLTPMGRQQARALGEYLRQGPADRTLPPPEWNPQNVGGFDVTHLYTSLMIRSVATGTILAQALGLPLVAWVDLHEVGGVVERDDEGMDPVGLPGRNRAYFEAHYPDLILPESLGEAGWWNRPYEERERRPERAQRFVRELLQRHDDSEDNVAVISHGAFYSYVMHAIFELPHDPPLWFYLENTAVTRLSFTEEGVALVYANNASHLPRDLVT
jgi:2,3-bisphosphoglycerate-dependent phosphoglycerate mutase